MISPDINANTAGVVVGSSMSDKALTQLHKLQEKVRALEKQNAVLRRNRESREEHLDLPQEQSGSLEPDGLDTFELIDVHSLQGGEEDWLIDSSSERDDVHLFSWLRQGEADPTAGARSPLLSRLADIAQRSPVQSYLSPNSSGSSLGAHSPSPLRSYMTSSTPTRLGLDARSGFDSRTFTRKNFRRGMVAAATFSLDEPDDLTPVLTADRRLGTTVTARDGSFHRLAFSGTPNRAMDLDANDCDILLNKTFDTAEPAPPLLLNGTFTTGRLGPPADRTYDKEPTTISANSTFCKPESAEMMPAGLAAAAASRVLLNATFDASGAHGGSAPGASGQQRLSGGSGAPLNATYDASRGGGAGVKSEDCNSVSTSPQGGGPATAIVGLNQTFDRSNSSGGGHNRSDGACGFGGGGGQRKMSEDRLSSASSGNHLSRGSSHDGMLEDMEVLSADMDRLSTTSGMSESSASHRLNDVQDVQDVARMQEESLRDPVSANHLRSATISPSSEQSLCSPLGEEGGGYQSEESCGSEAGGHMGGPRPDSTLVLRGRPHRGEIRYNNISTSSSLQQQYRAASQEQQQYHRANQEQQQQYRVSQYSSQDSLPDSPYSSQSLDSHNSQGLDLRRSMPNLNKVRGGVGVLPRPQYGLSRQHASETRLQPPTSRLQAPSGRPGSGLRAPSAGRTSAALGAGSGPTSTASVVEQQQQQHTNSSETMNGFARPEVPARKYSGIARPTAGGGGIPRPGTASRLPAPGNRVGAVPGRRPGTASGLKVTASYQPRGGQGTRY